MDRRTLIAAGAAVVAAGGAGAWYLGRPQEAQVAEGVRLLAMPNDFGVTEMTLGDPAAPVEVVEYASFTCPHCARFHEGAFKELKANYIDTGKVHFGYREVYFDRPGLWASLMARCGGPLRFFSIVDMLYENQREWAGSGDPALIAEELKTMGKVAGLDQEAVDACMSDAETATALNNWFQENAERDAINSTPSFMINGQKYANMPYTEFAGVLDGLLVS